MKTKVNDDHGHLINCENIKKLGIMGILFLYLDDRASLFVISGFYTGNSLKILSS